MLGGLSTQFLVKFIFDARRATSRDVARWKTFAADWTWRRQGPRKACPRHSLQMLAFVSESVDICGSVCMSMHGAK